MATILIGRVLNAATDSVTVVQGAPGATPWPVTGVVTAQDPSIVLPSNGSRNSIVDPSSAQTSNYTNNTPPTLAVLSNTVPSYASLGGLWRFAAVAGSETDYALFGYEVPSGVSLYVRSVVIGSFIFGSPNSKLPMVLQWALAANSDNESLANADTHPPEFLSIGMQSAPHSARIGDSFEPGPAMFRPDTPLVVLPQRFFHIVLRIPIANPLATLQVRGFCMIDGYFQ